MGVWIETQEVLLNEAEAKFVTPCVGVWIETTCAKNVLIVLFVTPCVGVWIETRFQRSTIPRV